MIAKNPNEGGKNMKPVLIVVLAIVIISVILSFIIPGISKGKKDSSSLSESNSTEATTTTPVDPLTTTPPDNGFSIEDFVKDVEEEYRGAKDIINDKTPINLENVDNRFPENEEDDAAIQSYIFEYTEGNISQFFNFVAAFDDLAYQDQYSFIKFYYENVLGKTNNYDSHDFDNHIQKYFTDWTFIREADVILQYPYHVYNKIGSNSFDFGPIYCVQELESMNSSDSVSYQVSGGKVKNLIEEIPLYYCFLDFAKQYGINGDLSTHDFKIGAPGPCSEDIIDNGCVAPGETVAYTVPIKDNTSGVHIFCFYNSSNKLVGMIIL